ncbi:D-alanyl-lipoteichoic acid acyltransferase DltB (MBOAT superfamily) [Roseivirga ehrenbergii]|uniref:Acyltransferase n=1 Tax=Roseivirga ehrenbergii (strain DSM 102268 / JCM 13514 / KCTC 12282 / NCIMB 14502 / KMM 6017) TaxID=279360 RepID=A0A150XEA8_ROSEK|nr:MBOAT family O-acyltransferase [Roseivirga ehrenbergii]KYG77038.1 acyltransferase [Roseivirga ehrenbergii]TCL14460.1 D-alanyl-lipoteichoic acid acyltransferase DltB (MBOAT superfamily) [Roseivirga ehrenbergii]
MLFNSVEYLIFLPVVFSIYWLLAKRERLQNLFLLFSSYIFYGWWDWRFLGLIIFSSIVDYVIALEIERTDNISLRKSLVLLSIFTNIGILGVFKYYNFFIDSLSAVIGFNNDLTLSIILPVGISFYTFQTLSYTIDVSRGRLMAERNLVTFFTYVSFFPQLVAGPIERAVNLLPQFKVKRKFEYSLAVDGCRQILWGFFKKMVIADNCAIFVNQIFSGYDSFNGSTLALGAVLFAFQIYGDFSGYSDIAIGTSKLFGIELMKNFNFPYFSRDIPEFWRRWHISLSSWFRDYLYIPLGGSKGRSVFKIRNVILIFVISGIWHGANWTFVFWGFFNAIFFIPFILLNRNRENMDRLVGVGDFWRLVKDWSSMGLTFGFTCIAWVFFRSSSISDAFDYISRIFSTSFFEKPDIIPLVVLILIMFLLIVEWFQRREEYGFRMQFMRKELRWLTYFFVIMLILVFGVFEKTEFIYFAF